MEAAESGIGLVGAPFFLSEKTGSRQMGWGEIYQRCRALKKGRVITKGVFSLEESLEPLKNGRILLCFPHSGDSLESLESLNSLESLETLKTVTSLNKEARLLQFHFS